MRAQALRHVLPWACLLGVWGLLAVGHVWLKPLPGDRALGWLKVGAYYVDGKRLICDHLDPSPSPQFGFDLRCYLATSYGYVTVTDRWADGSDCVAELAGQALTCRVQGIGNNQRLVHLESTPDLNQEFGHRFGGGDFTLPSITIDEGGWLLITLAAWVATSLLSVWAVFSTTGVSSPGRVLLGLLASPALLVLNLIYFANTFPGLVMID